MRGLSKPDGRWLARAAIIALLARSLAQTPLAQQINATVSGNVTNEREEIVPRANVPVESPELGVQRMTATNDEGYFVVPNLPVGVYSVTVEAEGFAVAP